MNLSGRSFSRIVRTAGLLAGLVVVFACVSQSSSTEQNPAPTATVEVRVERGTATKEAPTATVVRATAMVEEAPTPTAGTLPTVAASEEKVSTPVPTIVKEEIEMTPSASVPAELQGFVEHATADLAERLAIDSAQIQVVEVKEVVWPDAGLGCPQPGMRYKQVPQDGLLIRLSVGERAYDYHSGGSRDPFLCEQMFNVPKITPLDLDDFVPPPGSENE